MFLYKHRVNYSDTDVSGWIYYSKPLEWMEWCRVEFFRHRFGGIIEFGKETGITIFPASVQVNYRKGIFFDDKVDLELRVKEIHNYSFVFTYKLLSRGDTSITAELNMVVADGKTNRPTKIPDSVREYLEEHLEPGQS